MTAVKNITSYVKENLVKFMLLLVCLTLCLAMRYAALGKYVSIIEESSQAVAGEFFFTSNYLAAEPKAEPYVIANWDRSGDYITFDIKNYSNALKFNEKHQDIYYYVESNFYDDKYCTGNLSLTDKYKVELVTHYGEVDDTDPDHPYYPGEIGTITVDGKTYPVGKIEGGSTKTQTVYTLVHSSEVNADGDRTKIMDNVYVKFIAHCIPISDLSKITLYQENTNTSSGNKFSGSSDVVGVFNSDLSAFFMMGSSSSTAMVEMGYDEEDGSQRLWISLSCTYLENQGVADVEVYFDTTRVNPVEGLYQVLTIDDYEEQCASDAAFKVDHPYPHYVKTQLNSFGSDTVYFLKEYFGKYTEGEVKIHVVTKKN